MCKSNTGIFEISPPYLVDSRSVKLEVESACYIGDMTNMNGSSPSSLGERVARYRKEMGFASAEKLADVIIQTGAPATFKRSTVRSIENGKKLDVTVTELLLLSRALKISPIMLIVDVNNLAGSIEYIGLDVKNNYYLMQWLLMRAYYPGTQSFYEDTPDKVNRARMLMEYVDRYRSGMSTYRFEKHRIEQMGEDGMGEFIENMNDAKAYADTVKTLVKREYGMDVAELDSLIGS